MALKVNPALNFPNLIPSIYSILYNVYFCQLIPTLFIQKLIFPIFYIILHSSSTKPLPSISFPSKPNLVNPFHHPVSNFIKWVKMFLFQKIMIENFIKNIKISIETKKNFKNVFRCA